MPTDIRLGWKGLPRTNALAYCEKSQLTAVKCFITLAPGIRIFYFSGLKFLEPTESVFCPVFRFVLEADPSVVTRAADDVKDVVKVDLAGRVRLVTVRHLSDLNVA